MMENNKGITLMSLAIMIVILLILATIGINYSSDSLEYAILTKLTTEFEIINTRISILNQSKNYQSEYVNYGLDATDEDLISQINNLLDEKLVDVYNISTSDLNIYKTRFQYCSAKNINKKLGIDGIKGSYLVNIQNKIVISFDGIKYEGKKYHTLEELEKDGLAKNLYKVQYYKHENPYIPQGHYYAGGTWDTGYIIGDSQDDKYTGDEVKVLTTEMVEEYRGNIYMWIPIEEKNDNNAKGINWMPVTSDTDYINIQSALDAYKTTYIAPEYSSQWYTTANAQYAYKNTEGRLVKYPTETPTEADTNNLLSSIYSNGGLYIKIHDAKYVEIETKPELPLEYQQVEYIQSTGTQYIDTGMKLNNNSKIELEIEITEAGDYNIFGSRNSASESNIGINASNTYKGITVDFQDYTKNRLLTSYDINKKIYEISNEMLRAGESSQIVSSYSQFTTPDNAYIFSMSGNAPVCENAKMKLYYCKIFNGDILARDYIPVLDKNGVACLYDKVEGKYYYNQGTGVFLYG